VPKKKSTLLDRVRRFASAIVKLFIRLLRWVWDLLHLLQARSRGRYQVKRVPDGDTLAVVDAKGDRINVRLAYIDTPEVAHNEAERKSRKLVYKSQFKWGDRAKDRLQDLVEAANNEVLLTLVDTDRYGRHVCEVRLANGTFLQEVLVSEGLAQIYRQYIPKDCPSLPALEAAEALAKRRRRGLWSDEKFIPAWEFRKLTK